MSASIKKFWNFGKYQQKEWFRMLSIMLLILLGLYILLHTLFSSFSEKYAFEYTKLDATQIQQINRIYFDSLYKDTTIKDITETDVTKKNSPETDSTKTDTTKKSLETDVSANKNKDSCKCSNNNIRCDRVIKYLEIQFPDQDNSPNLEIEELKSYLCSASSMEAVTFLSNLKLKANSFFWLKGALLYIEIIFWSLFGVFSSLLFNIGVVAKKSTSNPQDITSYFDNSEIPSQIAKMFYAPLCTLVVALGYNLISSQNPVDIYAGKGILVFAFIGGYYSSRLIAFLDRFKDLLLPNSGTTDTPKMAQPPLKNIIIELKLPSNIDVSSISPTTITLKDKVTGDKVTASKIDKNSGIFIADFVKPAKYVIEESVFQAKNTELKVDTELTCQATDIEMKSADLFISMCLTATIIKVSTKLIFADLYKDIKPEDLKRATVSVLPASGNPIDLKQGETDDLFTSDEIAFGSYTLKASCPYNDPKDATAAEIQLVAPDKAIEISANTKDAFEMILDKPQNPPVEPIAATPEAASDEQNTITRDPKNYD